MLTSVNLICLNPQEIKYKLKFLVNNLPDLDFIHSNQQRVTLVSSLHGDLSDKGKVKTVTLVDFVLLVVFSGCGLPVIIKPTFDI